MSWYHAAVLSIVKKSCIPVFIDAGRWACGSVEAIAYVINIVNAVLTGCQLSELVTYVL